MNLIAAGIDYSLANIDIREEFSLTTSKKIELYTKIKEVKDILGAVIISTCNRMEVYFSCEENNSLNPFEVVCKALGKNYNDYKNMYKLYFGDKVIEHLCLLSCGAQSQIFGEDQIITQVKDAITFAREQKAADSALEVVFRSGITCGKRVRTEVDLTKKDVSIADKVIEAIKKENLDIKNVLVIGNGEMGRRVTTDLLKEGFAVCMTVRHYKYKAVEVPKGAQCIDYYERYEHLAEFDAVVSATLSPHFTIKKEELLSIKSFPKYYFDLAVPRDVEKSVADLSGTHIYDVDSLSGEDEFNSHQEQLTQIKMYIEKYKIDIKRWEDYHNRMVVC